MLLLICPGSKGVGKEEGRQKNIILICSIHFHSKPIAQCKSCYNYWAWSAFPGMGKGKSERTEGIPTGMKINRTNKNKSQEEKSLLKDILGSKTVCPLLCFAFLTENTVRFGKATMPQKKASALFKVIYVSQLFILPLILWQATLRPISSRTNHLVSSFT